MFYCFIQLVKSKYCSFAVKYSNSFTEQFNWFFCYFVDESDETKAFLTLLSTWDKQELEQKLGQRVEFSKRAIGKLLQAFDRLLQRNEKLNKGIQEKVNQEVEGLNLSATSIKKEPSDVKMEVDEKKETEEEAGEKSVKTEEDKEIKTEPEEKTEGMDKCFTNYQTLCISLKI